MGINFPASPAVGTLYPSPAVAGVPQYRWDGEKWSQQTLQSKQAIYSDGSVPMTAQLTLVAPPANPTDAAAKSYVDSRPPPAGSLRYDIDQTSLTDAQKLQSRQNVYAAPLDAMGYFGLQVNGSCELDQLNGGVVTTTAGYNVDNWSGNRIGTWICNWQRTTDAPAGYSNSIKVTVTTGNVSPAPGDLMVEYHIIEGLRIARLRWGTASAQPISIAFWVKAHRAGNYGGSVRNSAGDRSYPFPFTINAADTWEYKTVTIPGDTAGTWGSGLASAMLVTFAVAAGSSFLGTASVWQAGNMMAPSGVINGAQAATDTFQVTGLLVLPGLELPSVLRAPFTQRQLADELIACHRYLEASLGGMLGTGFCYSAGLFLWNYVFKTVKRVAPTGIIIRGAATDFGVYRAGAHNAIDTIPTLDSSSQYLAHIRFTHSTTPFTAGQGGIASNLTGNGFILFDARM